MVSKISQALELIRESKMSRTQFKQALQQISRFDLSKWDADGICASIAGTYCKGEGISNYENAEKAFDGFKLLLSNYSRPDRVIVDYKILTEAF